MKDFTKHPLELAQSFDGAVDFSSAPTNYITAIGTDLVWIVGS